MTIFWSLDVAQVAQALAEWPHEMGLKGSRGVPEETDPVQLPRLLPLSGERRKCEAESENDREPDQPHGHLGGGRLSGSLAERWDRRT